MASLKDNISHIAEDTRAVIMDHMKLFSIRQTEKLSRFFGLLSTIFIISSILLIVIIFFSFALAGILNHLLNSYFGGYLIVSGIYVLLILSLILSMKKSKRPLMSNAIARSLSTVFEIESAHPNDLDGLALEKEAVKEKINLHKEKINLNFEMLRYSFMEHLFKEFFGLFSTKKEKDEEGKTSSGPESDEA
jgi:hypothetical protein